MKNDIRYNQCFSVPFDKLFSIKSGKVRYGMNTCHMIKRCGVCISTKFAINLSELVKIVPVLIFENGCFFSYFKKIVYDCGGFSLMIKLT